MVASRSGAQSLMVRRGKNMLSLAGKQLMASVASMVGTMIHPNGAYHGASSTRKSMQAWNPTNSSADVDTLANTDVIRARARDLVRNHPTAAAAVNKKPNWVVNAGLRFKSRLDHEALGITREEARVIEKQITKLFHRWAKSKNSDATKQNTFYQNQSLVFRSMIEAGDIFVGMPFIDRPTAILDLAIKLIESDLCRNPSTALPTKRLAGGIEQDEWGATVAYWFAKNYYKDIDVDIADEPKRVPAYGEETGRPLMLHVFTLDRPGQRRGMSLLAPIIEPLKQDGRYRDSELMAAVIAGMYTVFIRTLTGAGGGPGNVPPEAQVGNHDPSPTKGTEDYEMSHGGVVELGPDEDIQIADPNRPNPNFDSFTSAILREIGGALGMGSEMIQGLYRSSYTAARAAFIDAYNGFKVDKANLESDLLEPIKDTLILNAVLRGVLDLPGYLDSPQIKQLWEEGIWVGEAPAMLDPAKETKAVLDAVDGELISRRRGAMEYKGEDYEQVVNELGEEKVWREEAGLAGSMESNDDPNSNLDTDSDTNNEDDSEDDTEDDSENDEKKKEGEK